ncbi:nucleotidyl transferase AbiEii/AbiGii toxin family protein [Galbibacter sp.]|uniref:nucleotidyl transferase AbiEii/AbiGii toxin family protein n=1 Tax=Galbibacter sp. TaxID=2918471 RepID=UPI003A919009
MIAKWLESYNPGNEQEAKSALREIMQEIALVGLYRAGFYEVAAFYGGTALRIFYGLDRFSEDLDFSLLTTDPEFNLANYQKAIVNEFESLGMKVSVREKIKTNESTINSAFLKSETLWRELLLESIIPQHGIDRVANIKIKIEVDTQPPLGFETEEKLLIRPFSFYVKCFTLPDLFAGKMHALLFRKWGKNVKGRDWYDMEWYIKRGTPLNLSHFAIRAKDSGDWHTYSITDKEFRVLLAEKIDTVNFEYVKNDIKRFISDQSGLEIWSPKYFHELVEQLRIL